MTSFIRTSEEYQRSGPDENQNRKIKKSVPFALKKYQTRTTKEIVFKNLDKENKQKRPNKRFEIESYNNKRYQKKKIDETQNTGSF